MHSDHVRKYGFSESMIQALYYDIVGMIQALYYDIVGNKPVIKACIMDSEIPYFLISSLCIKCLVHQEVYCIYWSCLLFFLYNRYIHAHTGKPFHAISPNAVV